LAHYIFNSVRGEAAKGAASREQAASWLAVVTGLAGAEAASATVVVGGLAEAAAGAVAM
jgi:hypothetical protein